MNKSDLIIIGSGPGGYRAAEYAAKNGLSVVMIEKDHIGGTCLNEGCIPTKTLCHQAKVIDTLTDAESYGLSGMCYSIDFPKIMERKETVISQLQNGIEVLMQQSGVTVIMGEARFKDEHTVSVGEEEYTAKNIIIATGSHAKMPPIEGTDSDIVITSRELLHIHDIPKRLCIVGAGVIGMEFASVFSSFGSEVTVIEFLKESLPVLDSDIAKRLRQTLAKRGVNFYMQSAVKEISGHTVRFERKNKMEQIEADLVLIATGRGANTDGLHLEEIGIENDRTGIKVDENMQTNIPDIYAVGDVNGKCMLAHAATAQGLHVVNHILGKTDHIRLDIMPSAIFTNPEAASVGMSEDMCKDKGIEYICKKGYYRTNGKALAMNETEGMIKLISDPEGNILGCHAFGAHTADIIQEVSVLMCKHTTVEELKDMIHTHPTFGEILQGISEQF
jgi:dihydrolipoamide dehydrogenase